MRDAAHAAPSQTSGDGDRAVCSFIAGKPGLAAGVQSHENVGCKPDFGSVRSTV